VSFFSYDLLMVRFFGNSCMACLVVAGVCGTAMTGCSNFEDLPDEPRTAPDVQKAGTNVKVVAGQYHLSGQLEIAGPIEAPIVSMLPWMSALQPRFTVALFYKADTFVSSREATMADRCDSQIYRPLSN
jgi:hypothetical protein